MEFDSLADQLDWVMGRFFAFVSTLLPEDERKELESLSPSIKQLAALEIAKHKEIAFMERDEVLEKLARLFPDRAERMKEIFEGISEEQEERIRRYVAVVTELLA